jgi:hypothetical protein
MRLVLFALAAWLPISVLVSMAVARFIEVGSRKPWPSERSPASLKGSAAARRTAA